MKRIGLLVAALGWLACGSSVLQGPDGGTQTGACASLGECACFAASDRCSARTEACWCPSVCDPSIACICGGGEFLSCETKSAATSCDTELARVQSLCAGKPFVQYIAGLCSSNANCVASCLATNIVNVDSCAQIDCYFCPVCDCAPPPPSPLRNCLQTCTSQ
jgi:hypothetical protein